MPQAIEQVAQRAADNQRVGNIVQLLRRLRTVHQHRQHYANADRDPGKEPALPAAAVGEKAKGRAIVAGIMQIKRREQRNRLPRAKFWRIRNLLPRSIISTATTTHSQRSPVEQIDLLIRRIYVARRHRRRCSHSVRRFPRVPPPCRYRWCNASSAGISHLQLYSMRLSAL